MIACQDENENLERLEQFTTILSKLSDRYSQKDQIYAKSFRIDVIDIFQASELPPYSLAYGSHLEEEEEDLACTIQILREGSLDA